MIKNFYSKKWLKLFFSPENWEKCFFFFWKIRRNNIVSNEKTTFFCHRLFFKYLIFYDQKMFRAQNQKTLFFRRENFSKCARKWQKSGHFFLQWISSKKFWDFFFYNKSTEKNFEIFFWDFFQWIWL